MKTTLMTTVFAICAACVAQTANTSVPCSTWVDPVLRVEFPERLGDLEMSGRRVYNSGDKDYSLLYKSSGGEVLDLYVYTLDGKPMPDGVNPKTREQLDEVAKTILACYENVKALDMMFGGKLPRSGLSYEWTSFVFKFTNGSGLHMSIAVVFSWRNRFVKLRYSKPVAGSNPAPCETLPQTFLSILSSLDDLINRALKASALDVYAIADPKSALEAIRQKWLGAGTRVSMWEMPDYAKRFREIDEFQEWCEKDKAARYGQFKNAVLEAIDMRIEPAIWFYNLACARAVLGESPDGVFDALEQAVAAGYNEPERAGSDEDLKSVADDPRFAKLCEVMGVVDEHWNSPKRPLCEWESPLLLSNDNVYYAFHDYSYQCILDTTNNCPVVYLNHHEGHDAVPCDGLIVPQFPEEAIARRRNIGAANMHFIDRRANRLHPTVVASCSTYEEDRLNKAMSIPAVFGISGKLAWKEVIHSECWNVLGVYTAASDYGFDGIDRFIGYFPCCIAHFGGPEEADKFVCLYRDIVRALPSEVRGNAPCAVLDIIRHAQKCVTDEGSFMSGIAQRPVLSFADIDVERAIADAKAMGGGSSHVVSVPFFKDVSLAFEVTSVTDIWGGQCNGPCLAATAHNGCFVASWGEKTGMINVEAANQEEGDLVWKVLQGDESKVRIVPQQGDPAHVRIEVDYHEVFDVALPNGKTVKSSRVDVGCFCVKRGSASVPAIVSVYFSPNETREYDADGRLVSIDYARRQVDGWRPQLCAKGFWKDVFRYSDGGTLAGWTRLLPQEDGSVKTNEFTREGLVVMSRDALGRPKDVRRDMTMEWIQDFGGESFTGEEYSVHIAAKGIEFNELDYDPCGEKRFATLAWQYEYSDDGDFAGRPSPKPLKPYACRPEMCVRADFSAASGFDYPLVEQMMAGYAVFSSYKHGFPLDGDIFGYMREDSPLALREKGLTPPKTLKKMKFCQWRPSTNDLWNVGIEGWTGFVSSNLYEQGDGVYRLYSSKQKCFLSVKETYSLVNNGNEHCAYVELDKVYKRSAKRDLGEERMIMTDGRPLRKEDLPEGVNVSIAAWEIAEDVFFCIEAFHDSGFVSRDFLFLGKGDDGLPSVTFRELPSRAFGNTVLAAFSGDAEAMNNLAVLLYAEVANPGQYKDAPVVDLLQRSAAKGCETARYNLQVFYENRGDESGKRN